MDWPLTGLTVGVVAAVGFLSYELVGYVQYTPEVVKKAPLSNTNLGSVSAPSMVSVMTPASAPVVRPSPEPVPARNAPDPVSIFSVSSFNNSVETPAAGSENQAFPLSSRTQEIEQANRSQRQRRDFSNSINSGGSNGKLDSITKPPPNTKVASILQSQVEVWRVRATAKATYFNLGGHINSAGVVDSLASEHLRDAFKIHRNFSKLPLSIRTHILTQDIDLTKIAQYRVLLGMDDKKLEEEQAVRFERVAHSQ